MLPHDPSIVPKGPTAADENFPKATVVSGFLTLDGDVVQLPTQQTNVGEFLLVLLGDDLVVCHDALEDDGDL